MLFSHSKQNSCHRERRFCHREERGNLSFLSCHREALLSSRGPFVIASTAWRSLLSISSSRAQRGNLSFQSCHREALLSSRAQRGDLGCPGLAKPKRKIASCLAMTDQLCHRERSVAISPCYLVIASAAWRARLSWASKPKSEIASCLAMTVAECSQ